MSSFSVFIGIDVACAAGRQLPLCAVSARYPLMPLLIPNALAELIPRGAGNKEVTAAEPFKSSARGVVDAIGRIMDEMGWKAERIAVDAPAAPPQAGLRASEADLGSHGLSYFQTPEVSAWRVIRQQCIDHLADGGRLTTLRHAKIIWMLFGFELFSYLNREFLADVIDVYPYAIVRALLPACAHKTTEKGYRDQLVAVAARTGWEPQALHEKLEATVPGRRDDRLDAFMAAWVASLPREKRRAFGDPGNPLDAIWTPI